MMKTESYLGGDLKFRFRSSGAFSFDEHEWDAIFFIGKNKCKMTKRNVDDAYTLTCDQKNMGVKPCSDGSWVFLLDSEFFGPGRLIAVIEQHIPDEDFDPTEEFESLDSVRNEVERFSLHTILNI